jgi:hypothetical protein
MKAKTVILVAVIIFLGFWMVTDPSGMANIAKEGGSSAWTLTTDLFSGLIDFIKQL